MAPAINDEGSEVAEANVNVNQLVPALKRGDKDAYRDLVRCMGEPLLRYAATVTRDADLAQDVVQDALLRIYKGRAKLSEHSEFRGLCFRTVRNLARNALRDQSLRKQREQEANDMRSDDDHSGHSLAQTAWEHVKKLPVALREVIELRFAFGLSRDEVAATLELPEGTVATRQRKALEELRNGLMSASVVPAIGFKELATLLVSAPPSAHVPNVVSLEELVMNGISSMKLKATLMVTAAMLVAVLVLAGGGTVAYGIANPQPALQPVASTQTLAPDATGTVPREHAVVDRSTLPESTEPPLATQQPEASPSVPVNAAETAPASTPPAAEPATPKAEATVQEAPTPTPAPAQQGRAPEFTSEPSLLAPAGQPWQYAVSLSGSPAPHLTAATLPVWLKLEGNLLVGTPTAADAGASDWIVLLAVNGVGDGAEQRFRLLISTAPEITSAPPVSIQAGAAYSYKVTTTGTPAPTLTLRGAPSWLTLNGDTVSGTPDRTNLGESGEMVLVATNGTQPDAEQKWSITVTGAPEFTSTAVTTVKVGELYEYEIEVSGFPAPTLKASGLPKWLVLDGNTLRGTPKTADLGKTRQIVLRAESAVKPNAQQGFFIEVLDNPGYVEIPWDEDDLKKFFKVGMKWELTLLFWASGMPGEGVPVNKYEIIAIDDAKGLVTLNFIEQEEVIRGTKLVWVDKAAVRIDRTFDQLGSMQIRWLASQGTVKYLAKQRVKIGGSTHTCHVFELTALNKGAAQTQLKRISFIEGRPGIVALAEDLVNDNGKQIWKATEFLSAFATK